jgi:hypothetical protein
MKKKLGRPPRPHRRVPPVSITATPKLVEYLDDLVDEEGYGNSKAEVARTLVWRGIEDLIKGRILDRRKGDL